MDRSIWYLVISLIIAGLIVSCGSAGDQENEQSTMHNGFDSLRAAKLGADQYGMKKYVMAFLYRGPNRDLDSAKAMELQMAHLENIGRMAEEGKLALAGPFLDTGDLRGIYIFNVETVEEAKVLTNTDPAIQEGSLEMELKPWYGSAALVEVNDIHKTLSNKEVTE